MSRSPIVKCLILGIAFAIFLPSSCLAQTWVAKKATYGNHTNPNLEQIEYEELINVCFFTVCFALETGNAWWAVWDRNNNCAFVAGGTLVDQGETNYSGCPNNGLAFHSVYNGAGLPLDKYECQGANLFILDINNGLGVLSGVGASSATTTCGPL